MGKQPPIVLFNASVILAGLKSPQGGSGKLLEWSRKKRILGVVSEIILDEVVRNAHKIGLSEERVVKKIELVIIKIASPPELVTVESFQKIVVNQDDTHVLATSREIKADFLVTLDKRHLLILKRKVKKIKIVSPGDLIETLS